MTTINEMFKAIPGITFDYYCRLKAEGLEDHLFDGSVPFTPDEAGVRLQGETMYAKLSRQLIPVPPDARYAIINVFDGSHDTAKDLEGAVRVTQETIPEKHHKDIYLRPFEPLTVQDMPEA